MRNSGRTLDAVNERRGQLRQLIVNANDIFGALASRNESLAEAIFIFPTFLDESKATLAPAQDLLPTTPARSCATSSRWPATCGPRCATSGDLAPDLEALFRDLDPLIDESPETLPSAARFIRGAEPLFEALHPYLTGAQPDPLLPQLPPGAGGRLHHERRRLAQRHAAARSTPRRARATTCAAYSVNQLPQPRHLAHAPELRPRQRLPGAELPAAAPAPLGIYEAFDCKPTGGEKPGTSNGEPPCFVAPRSLWDGGQFPRVRSGEAPIRPNPEGTAGSEPATP